MEVKNGFDSNYRFILVAARRARQIQNGARPLVETESTKPCRVAELELEAHKVPWYVPEAAPKKPEGGEGGEGGQK